MNRRNLFTFACGALAAPFLQLFGPRKSRVPDAGEILGAAIKAGIHFKITSYRLDNGYAGMQFSRPVRAPTISGWGNALIRWSGGPKANCRYRWFNLLPRRPHEVVERIAHHLIGRLSAEEEQALNQVLADREGGPVTVAELRRLAK